MEIFFDTKNFWG